MLLSSIFKNGLCGPLTYMNATREIREKPPGAQFYVTTQCESAITAVGNINRTLIKLHFYKIHSLGHSIQR